jgi:hypothetical protein
MNIHQPALLPRQPGIGELMLGRPEADEGTDLRASETDESEPTAIELVAC